MRGVAPAETMEFVVKADMGVEEGCGISAQLERRELPGELPGDISIPSPSASKTKKMIMKRIFWFVLFNLLLPIYSHYR